MRQLSPVGHPSESRWRRLRPDGSGDVTVKLLVGDVHQRLADIPDRSVDLIACSPPFLALRKYGDDDREMGSERTPADFLDALLQLTTEFRRVLTSHGSIAIELGDTYSGSGGADGDYGEGGLRDGQPVFKQTNPGRTARFNPNGDRHGGISVRPQHDEIPKKGNGWPLAKSLTNIPGLYAASLAYGYNMLNPAHRFKPWIHRNQIVWARPNPPVGALGDKVRPATSYITIACTSPRRYFDLDGVRTPSDITGGSTGFRTNGRSGAREHVPNTANNGGAPPLDWWDDDDDPTGHATLILPTQPYSGWTTTSRQVPCGPDDGGRRTTSPDCPVHAGLPGQLPRALRDAREGIESSRIDGTDAGHAQEQLLGFAPTDPPPEQPTAPSSSDSPARSCDVAATAHSKIDRRTVPAPSTSPPDTAFVGTTASTGDTPALPESSEPHRDNPSSSSGEACPPAGAPETASDTAGTPDPSSACTCSFSKTVTESTSHYATWPEKLAARLIEMMCPRQVCTTCGEPSTRIVERDRTYLREAKVPKIRNDSRADGGAGPFNHTEIYTTLGWSDCGHNTWRPGMILDPFAGSGTTLAVAQGLGRDCTGIELYEANAELCRKRVGMFLEVDGDTQPPPVVDIADIGAYEAVPPNPTAPKGSPRFRAGYRAVGADGTPHGGPYKKDYGA